LTNLVSYDPQFTITPLVLARVEAVAALRERIQAAAVELSWIPALQKDTRTRNVHASTAIEGNPLTITDARGVVAMRHRFGMGGHKLWQKSCDAGERWMLAVVM
jgi:hypothetical protein